MATKKMEEKIIKMEMPEIKTVTVCIEGDSDLCLNKMNYGNKMDLPQFRNGKTKFKHNEWGDIITSIHWFKRIDEEAIYKYATQDTLGELITHNAPCIPSFAFMSAFKNAVVRNNIDTYGTKFETTVAIPQDFIPIKFTEHYIRELLTSPKKGSPVISKLNQFSGWSAEIPIRFTETAYSFDSIVSIINLAGFGNGVGSGRKQNGLGRFHVTSIK